MFNIILSIKIRNIEIRVTTQENFQDTYYSVIVIKSKKNKLGLPESNVECLQVWSQKQYQDLAKANAVNMAETLAKVLK